MMVLIITMMMPLDLSTDTPLRHNYEMVEEGQDPDPALTVESAHVEATPMSYLTCDPCLDYPLTWLLATMMMCCMRMTLISL